MPLTSDRAEHRLRSRPRDRGTPSPPTSHHRPVITAFCACAWNDDLTPPCPSRQDPLRLEVLQPRPTPENSIQNLVALPSSTTTASKMTSGRTTRSPAPLRAVPLRPLALVPRARGRAGPHSTPRTLHPTCRALCGPVTRLAIPGLRSSPHRFTFGRGKARASPDLCRLLPPRPPAGGCRVEDPCFDRPPCPPSRGGVATLVDLGPGARTYVVDLAPGHHA